MDSKIVSNNIELFLQKISDNAPFIENLTTSCKHKKIIIDSLNEICIEHPEWKPVIMALSKYSKQKWALDQTFGKKYNLQVIFDKKRDIIESYPQTLDIVEIFDEAILDEYFLPEKKMKIFKNKNEFKVFEAAHDLKTESETISKYMMSTYYKSSVVSFCEAKGDEILKIIKKSNKTINSFRENDGVVFHDTDLFLKTIRKIKRKEKILVHFDNDEMFELINSLCEILKEYPLEGETLSKIIYSYVLEGKSDYAIAKERFVSETFVRSKRSQATELISLILWGCYSKEMLKTIA